MQNACLFACRIGLNAISCLCVCVCVCVWRDGVMVLRSTGRMFDSRPFLFHVTTLGRSISADESVCWSVYLSDKTGATVGSGVK